MFPEREKLAVLLGSQTLSGLLSALCTFPARARDSVQACCLTWLAHNGFGSSDIQTHGAPAYALLLVL